MGTLPTRSQVGVAAALACVVVGLVLRSAEVPLAAHALDLVLGAAAAGLATHALVGAAHVRRAVLAFLIVCGVGLGHLDYSGPVFAVYEVLVLATALALDRVNWWKSLAIAAGARAAGLFAFFLLP